MGRNPRSGYDFTLKCSNVFEQWRKEQNGMWQAYRIRDYTDGSATSQAFGDQITDQEYFKRKLAGTDKSNALDGWKVIGEE